MNFSSRIKKLEQAAIPSEEPLGLVWLPKECESVEEWLLNVEAWQNGQPIKIEWHAISARGVERIHYGVEPPTQS